MTKTINVAIGVLIEQRDRELCVLVSLRKEQAVLGGFWELPGGKIQVGESAQTCLCREFEEELGLTIAVGAPLSIIEHTYAHGSVRLHPFYCTRVSGQPRNLQVAEHRWLRAEELPAFKFPPANDALMLEVARRLRESH